MANAYQQVTQDIASGEIGYWDLPSDTSLRHDIQKWSPAIHVDHIVVLGIGGSSLGARAITEALASEHTLPAPVGRSPSIWFLDNSDPTRLAQLLQTLDLTRALFVVVSKSGNTLETLTQWETVRQRLEAANLPLAAHALGITDPENGYLRKVCTQHAIPTFEVPPNVGGRFSVLSAVGLLPAHLCGVDIADLQRGAQSMRLQCEHPQLEQNPAALLAALHVHHHLDFHRCIHVYMPYSDSLRATSSWFVQLWAESLGKIATENGQKIHRGPTPVASVGSTDQHSLLQLLMEGPEDKLVTFVQCNRPQKQLTIAPNQGPLQGLVGMDHHQVLLAQLQGTREALARSNRPSVTLEIEQLDAQHLGALLFLHMATTSYAAQFYGVHAYNQPGVELGKTLSFETLRQASTHPRPPRASRRKCQIHLDF